MARLGLALTAAVAALALGVAATTVLAQQTGNRDAGATSAQASPPEGRREAGGGGRDRETWDEWSERRRGDAEEDSEGDDRPMMRGERGFDDRREERGSRGGFGRWDEDGPDGPRGFAGPGPRGPMMMMMMAPHGLRLLCSPRSERIMNFMLDRLERLTQPTEAQRVALERLKDAAARARETAQAACPSGPPPLTPTGRLAAAEKHLEALLAAVRIVRPALEEYYGMLNDEQKARFYALRPWAAWHERLDRWRRDRWDRRGAEEPRQGRREEGRWRERERDRWSEPDDGPRGDRWRDRQDRDRDGWPDPWRGRL
ncbi:MAG: Spy/CpxP family protein refolding chaperone [Variibacter sp.]|nr:Spy/CpxP family protein refolding chaperone [Variibacter sp.]